MTSHALVEMIHSLHFKPDEFYSLSDFHHPVDKSYGRNKLYSGQNFGIFLMSWAKGDFTAIHNHGQTDWGAVVLLGDVHHRLYDIRNQKLVLTGKNVIPSGTVAPVQGDLIHAMGNFDDKPSMTLHIYGSNNHLEIPGISSRIFELEKNRIRTTNGEAYINGIESSDEYKAGIETDLYFNLSFR